MTVIKYYPPVSDIINVDDLPEFFNFISDGIENALGHVYFKNLQFSGSINGDYAYYSLDIISRKKIAFELPGTGILLVLNPDQDNLDISSFPVTVFWEWKILRAVNSFDLSGFSFSLSDTFQLALEVFGVSEEDVLKTIMNRFVISNQNTSTLQQFIDDINDFYGIDISLSTEPSEQMQELETAINEQGLSVYLSIPAMYVFTGDVAAQKKKVNAFFTDLYPEDIEAYIKKLIIPKFRATAEVSAALEFPRNVLVPWELDSEGHLVRTENENIKSVFTFSTATLNVDSVNGFGYDLDLAGELFPRFSEIGNTGILIEVQNLKFDLSRESNIAEANNDDRPVDFIGVYARAISVVLPRGWFTEDNESATDTSTTLRVAGYDILIGTGGLSGTLALETIPYTSESEPISDYFGNDFELDFPITGYQKNDDNTVSELEIEDYPDLYDYLNEHELSVFATTFKFPISLTEGSEQKVFTNAADYQKYLSGLGGTPGTLWQRLGDDGFRVGLQAFDITFKQNAIVHSSIEALLEIPKLKKNSNPEEPFKVGISGSIESNGDFKLTGSFEEPIVASLGDHINFNFHSVSVGREAEFFVEASVELDFPSGIMHTLLQGKKILIPKIRFYKNGRFEISNLTGFLPLSFELNLGPVVMAVSGIHISSVQKNHNGVERNYNYIGFDGAISINPYGIDARGEGVKYYYTTDDGPGLPSHRYLHIQTIEIDIVVPYNAPVVTISGMLSIPEPGVSTEYQGSVSFKSSKIDLSGSAAMRLTPKYPAFLVDASLNLPTPIPLGAVSIYGFRGLIGNRYVADKRAIPLPETAKWYEYYKAPQKGINIKKFIGPEQNANYDDAFSFGAGAVIGTTFDNGNVFSLRAMLLLSLPEVFIIDGQASILESRPGLTDSSEPPFTASIIWSQTSVEINLGADYKMPKGNGQIVEMYAQVEAYFPKNSSNWHVYFGTDQNPISVFLFKDLIRLRALGYLMLSSTGIAAGAKQDYHLKKSFFGIKVQIDASIEVGAFVSFERPQLGGYLILHGKLFISFWRVRLNINATAILTAEAAQPYRISVELKLKAKVDLGFFSITFPFTLKLRWEGNSHVNRNPIPPLPYNVAGMIDRTKELVKGTHMLTNEAFDLQLIGVYKSTAPADPLPTAISAFIPLDTYIDIKVVKGLDPSNTDVKKKIGGHTTVAGTFIDLIPPRKVVKQGKEVRQVKHKYAIKSIDIKCWDADLSIWKDYHPYEAVVEAADRPLVKDFKIGYWQRTGNQYNAIRLLATNPLSYLDAGEPGWVIPEQYGVTPTSLFCSTSVPVIHTTDVLNKIVGTSYIFDGITAGYEINGAYFKLAREFNFELPVFYGITPNKFKITNFPNPHDYAKSASFNNLNVMEIIFPEDVVSTELRISTQAASVTIRYYKLGMPEEVTDGDAQFIEVGSQVKTYQELYDVVSFNLPDYHAFIKIAIEPIIPESAQINSLMEQIEALFTDSYEDSDGIVSVTLPSDISAYNNLNAQLAALIQNTNQDNIVSCNSMDALLCGLYDQLMALDAFPEFTSEDDIKQNEIELFGDIFGDFVRNNQQYVSLLYQYEVDLLTKIENLSDILDGSYPPAVAEENYYSTQNTANALLALLLSVGQCNCTLNSEISHTTSFQEVKWKTQYDYDYESTIPGFDAVNSDMHLMQEAVARNPQPVWRPNATYLLKFELHDDVDDNSNFAATFTYKYGFKTAGPLGHFHNDAGVKYGNEYDQNGQLLNRKDHEGNISLNGELTNADKYTLTSLRSYIDYKRSYPNADGNIIMAKPAFYSHKQLRISVFFKKTFTFNLLNGWPDYNSDPEHNSLPKLFGGMNIMIKDPVNDKLIPYPLDEDYFEDDVPTVAPPAEGESGSPWQVDSTPNIPISISMLQNFLSSNEIPCNIGPVTTISPIHYSYSVVLTNLKPQKLYTAILNNAIGEDLNNLVNKEIHRFVFQTSRYGTFREQVESCYLKVTEDGTQKIAMFDIPVVYLSTDFNLAYGIVAAGPGTDAYSENFRDPFDRIVEGIFKMKPFEAAVTTEFNILRNSVSGEIAAIIIRNPEPFNDPKIPRNTLKETLRVMNGTTHDTSFHMLYSKDCSQAMIMKQAAIPEDDISFNFRYYLWNGSSYDEAESDSPEDSNVTVTLTF